MRRQHATKAPKSKALLHITGKSCNFSERNENKEGVKAPMSEGEGKVNRGRFTFLV